MLLLEYTPHGRYLGNGRGEPSGPSPALLGTRRYIQAHALLGILPQAPDVRRQRPPYSARASAPLTLLVPRCLPVQRLVVRSGPALDFVYVRLVARGFNIVCKLRALFGQGVRQGPFCFIVATVATSGGHVTVKRPNGTLGKKSGSSDI